MTIQRRSTAQFEEEFAASWLDGHITSTLADDAPHNIDEEKMASIINTPNNYKKLVTCTDFIKQVARIGIANSTHYLGKNLLKDGHVAYLSSPDYTKLGEVLITNYINHPNHCMSVAVLGLLLDLLRQSNQPDSSTSAFTLINLSDLDNDNDCKIKFKEVFFKAVLVHCMPYTPVFALYNRWNLQDWKNIGSFKDSDSGTKENIFKSLQAPFTADDKILLPKLDDVGRFKEFMTFLSAGKKQQVDGTIHGTIHESIAQGFTSITDPFDNSDNSHIPQTILLRPQRHF